MKDLFEDEQEDKDERLQINRKFAEEYESRKAKQIRFADDEDSSSSEEEDEDGVLLTSRLDADIMKTVNALRSKDESIYDPNKKFFDDYEEESGESVEKKPKSKKLKDVQREQILEQMEGKVESGKSKFAYNQEQEDIRKALMESAADSDDEDSDSDDGLLVRKDTVSDPTPAEEAEAQSEFLKEIAKTEATITEADQLVDPKGEVKDGNKFLLDYFKNRAWIDKQEYAPESDDDDNDSIDEVDKTDEFEASYNFRFEDMKSGADFSNIGYSREGMNTLRRPDETRKEKRKERKARKEAERRAKEEELKRLKNAKRKDLEDKMKRIKSIVGDVGEDAVDEATLMKLLEGDYDPEKFEELMQQAYSDDYYAKEEKEWKTDKDVKASLEQDEDGKEVVAQDDGALYDDGEEEIPEDEQAEEEVWEEEYEEEEEPAAESGFEKKVSEKVREELYKLDYEDIVAGMPTRFKYKQVEKNNFGLSTEEILLARDSTLKQFVSIKKMAPYRDSEHFVGARQRRKFREQLAQDMEEQTLEEESPKKKRRRLKKNNGEKAESSKPQENSSKPKKKRDKKKKSIEGVSDSRLASYNL